MPETEKKKIPWLFILSILIMIILTVITIFVTKALAEKKKIISLEVYTNEQLFPIEKRVKDRLQDIDFEKLLDELNYINFRIVNDGNRGISGETDIIENVQIIFPDSYRIVGKPKIIDNPYNIKVIFNELCKENEVKLWFNLLNEAWYFTLDIFYIGGFPVIPELKATNILDIEKTNVRNVNPTSEEKQMSIFNNILVITGVLIGWFALIMMLISSQSLRTLYSPKLVKFIKYFVIFMLSSGLGILIHNYYSLIKALNVSFALGYLPHIIFSLIMVSYVISTYIIIYKKFIKRFST